MASRPKKHRKKNIEAHSTKITTTSPTTTTLNKNSNNALNENSLLLFYFLKNSKLVSTQRNYHHRAAIKAVRERERELTEQGLRAGARDRRVRPWRRLRGELRRRPCRRHGTAPDPPTRARSECGTWILAFFKFKLWRSPNSAPISVNWLLSPILLPATLRFPLVPPWKWRREREFFFLLFE